MSLKLRRFEDIYKKKNMIDDKTWLIDDVLDPSSAFWKYKDKYEIDSLLSRISPLQTDGLFRIAKHDHVLDQFSEFVDFFSSLSKEQLQEYVEFIEDNEIDVMSDQVWRMLDVQDQRELFTKDPDIFDLWW